MPSGYLMAKKIALAINTALRPVVTAMPMMVALVLAARWPWSIATVEVSRSAIVESSSS